MRAIVLAAGKGTRMKSERTKVLHELCGRAMLWYVVRALRGAGASDILVVTNDEVQARVAEFGVAGVLQGEQLGTGHAVRVALGALEPRAGAILVASGDMPLVTPELFGSVAAALDGNDSAPMALVTVRLPVTSSFGRIVRNGDAVERIVEVRDASPAQLAIDEMNAGIYAFDEAALREVVTRIGCDNAQREYYLTDAVGHFVRDGRCVRSVGAADSQEVL
ncbi:MAG TPA: NTP transferase domain-containing protein, partial [Verrucomicrobiae bacterium]|nr:NTP transferase domain-containing protein [Verrucomicrobiae bacterium]